MSSRPFHGPSIARVTSSRPDAFTSLEAAELCAVVIELGLERGHSLAGLLEVLDGALQLQLEPRDPLLQFHRLRHVDLVGASVRGRSAVTTDAVQCGMSVRKLAESVTSNNGRAG
jgi:hypothetical protein